MKIIFFGTSNVALPILEALSRHHSIEAVVTRPDAKVGRSQTLTESPVSVLANEMKLPIIKPGTFKGSVGADIIRPLQELRADLFVVVSYGQILPAEIISLPKYKALNVHFSLLPKYRGPSPIQTALLNGEKATGTSIFILDEQVDHGAVLAQEKIPIDDNDNALSLSEKMAFKSAQLIIPTIHGYTSDTIQPWPQDEAQATHTEHIDKAHGKIDWSRTAQEIYNQFRAFYPWPGVWSVWNGKMVKIMDCTASDVNDANITPMTRIEAGTVLEGREIVCGGGTSLQIKTLQLEGKKVTSIIDFMNGYREFVGSRLE